MQAIHACFPIGLGALNPPASMVWTQHNDSLLQPASACQKQLKSPQLYCRCTGLTLLAKVYQLQLYTCQADLNKDLHYCPIPHGLQSGLIFID